MRRADPSASIYLQAWSITGRVEQTANRYREGKTEEYSNKQAWSAIGVQYPRGLTEGVIQVREQ